MDKLDTYPMSKDTITVGYSTHKKIVDRLEKALDLACDSLGMYSIFCPITSKKYEINECNKCTSKCKDEWKKLIMKGAQND